MHALGTTKDSHSPVSLTRHTSFIRLDALCTVRTRRLGQVGSDQLRPLLFVSFLGDVTCKRRKETFRTASVSSGHSSDPEMLRVTPLSSVGLLIMI